MARARRSESNGLNGASFGQVYLDAHWINKEMVREGWVWHYVRYSDCPKLAAAEAGAQKDPGHDSSGTRVVSTAADALPSGATYRPSIIRTF